jgi:ribosomal protein S12 methylthiotransferase
MKLKPKVYIQTLGCPKNLVDSEIMAGVLEKEGFRLAAKEKEAEIIILNTCSFILPAREESIAEALRLAVFKKKGSCRRLVMTGCLPQRYSAELQKGLPEFDLFLGVGGIDEIAGALRNLDAGSPGPSIGKPDFLMTAAMPRRVLTPPHIAYLKISEGCSNCCAYCAIPSIRGRLRSRDMDDILREAQGLAGGGARELIVIAQDTTSYGRDRKGAPGIDRLLQELSGLSGNFWIRLMYTYPARITKKLLETIAASEKVCNYIDMPVQHINDDILKSMGRTGTGRKVSNVIAAARAIIPGVSLRTSVIVGYPGETRKRFIELLEFAREARFEHLGAFAYSPEEGTKAARLGGRVPSGEIERRKEVLLGEQAEISRERNLALVGSVQEIIIDGRDTGPDYRYRGRTRGQAPEIDGTVFIRTRKKLGRGDFVSCRITGAGDFDLFAEYPAKKTGLPPARE